MKRFISAVLVFLMAVSCMPHFFVYAESHASAEKILSSVRSRIPDTSIYTDFDSITYQEGEKTVYSFNWSTSKDGNFKSMSVSALESGIIISYGITDTSSKQTPSGFDRITTEEAKLRTKELVKKLNPMLSDKLDLSYTASSESFSATSISFSITHMESGIPVLGDYGIVTVDLNAEKILTFNLSYTDGLTYPSPIKIVDLATAKKAFASDIGPDLFYRIQTNNAEKTVKIFPVYAPKTDDVYINALTGKAEKIIPYFDHLFSQFGSSDSIANGTVNKEFTEAELKELSNLKKLLSKSDAEQLLRENKLLGITEDYILEEYTTRKISNIEDTYGNALVFRKSVQDKPSFIQVQINAETGEILSYSRLIDEGVSTEAQPPTKEAALTIFKELAPKKHTGYRLRESDETSSVYYIFDRYVNNIRVEGNTASVEFDSQGNLVSWRISYTNQTFPNLGRLASREEICNELFSSANFSLVYVPQKSDKSLKHPDHASLIYSLDSTNIYFDAETKIRINYDGSPYKETAVSEAYTDISNHYAEEKINLLRRFGIGFDSPTFCPDATILQKDFIQLLVSSTGAMETVLIGNDTPTDNYYSAAKRLGILKDDEVSPDSFVTRLDAAKYICRSLGIEKYAQLDHIFSCPFDDVSQGKGYVTLLWGLEILKGTGKNTFSPNDNLTRAQSAILIYNILESR